MPYINIWEFTKKYKDIKLSKQQKELLENVEKRTWIYKARHIGKKIFRSPKK